MTQLINLIEKLPSHEALNNNFYRRWVNESLSIENIDIFALNYWEFSKEFPKTLARLIAITPGVLPQVEYAKILNSELGYGKVEKTHSVLFEKFYMDLAEKMGKPKYFSIENLRTQMPLLDGTKKLIEGERILYSENIAIGAGAQLALECQAYNMLTLLYEGTRNYSFLWPNLTNFHESCEFFYVHIGSAEKDHREEALSAVNTIIKMDSPLMEEVIYGFNEHLNLFANFWKAIADKMDT